MADKRSFVQQIVRGIMWTFAVIVAVIGLLIIFDPFYWSGIRANNYDQTGCVTNLNQIGKASLTYLDDYNGYYWTGSQPYTKALSRYLKDAHAFECKADKREAAPIDIDPATGKIVTGRSALRVSYLCNSRLWKRPAGKLRAPEIHMASKFILLVEDSSGDGTRQACLANPNSASAYHSANQAGRHSGSDNYVFADTHVKKLKGGKGSEVADGAVTYLGVTWDPLCP